MGELYKSTEPSKAVMENDTELETTGYEEHHEVIDLWSVLGVTHSTEEFAGLSHQVLGQHAFHLRIGPF